MMEVVAVVNGSDPIYALSTPYGRSALCIVRVSGASLPRGFLEAGGRVDQIQGVCVRSLVRGGFTVSGVG